MITDPGVDYEGTQGCEYEVSGAKGEPHWDRIFGYLLQHFGHITLFQTVFVLVDNRDLTAPRTEQASLAHWPTVAAWWASRLALHGPARELCDLIFVPIGPSAGLEHVHPTWAGTFVLCISFSGFQLFTLCYSIVTVFKSLYLKLQICGRSCPWFEMV